MTPEQFDQLALKVATEKFPICAGTAMELVFVEFARRLREEWVKGLKPVVWLLEGYDQKIGKPDISCKQGKHFSVPLYTLEELK